MSGFNMPDDEEWRDEGDSQAMVVMTLRDFFAALAMVAYLITNDDELLESATVDCAYTMADAMLRERMKP